MSRSYFVDESLCFNSESFGTQNGKNFERDLKLNNGLSPILEQHFTDAAFLWTMRDRAVASPHYSLSDLAHFDGRIEAHISGLRVAGQAGLKICFSTGAEMGGGEVFTASVLALEHPDVWDLIEECESVGNSLQAERGVVAALNWVSWEHARIWIARCLNSGSISQRRVALSGLATRRKNMTMEMEQALSSEDSQTIARALRAIGETKESSMLSHLHHYSHTGDEPCRFWAAWSLAVIGQEGAGESLKSFVDVATTLRYRAILMAPRVLGNCQPWLRELAQQESLRRYALIGCGVTGDPVYIPTLINQMAIPEYARVAGEAFSMITGVDLAYEDLDGDWPEGFEAGPTEDPEDENVDLDPDEDLPWPNAELIDRWWHEHSCEYQNGVRYLCGRPISDENCRRVLREGLQRQRISAAYELALMNPKEPLFEWRAPGWRQQEWLGLRRPRRSAARR